MKLALLGYGKMGKEIEQVALQRNHTILLKADVHNASSFSKEELGRADAAIEFSTPESAVSNIYKCFEAGIPVVVGTTGWYQRFEEVKKYCTEKNQSLFYASNFSIGVNIFFRVNEYLARIMNSYPEYDVKLEEVHHIHKLDSPSGTGLSLAEQVLSAIGRKSKWVEGRASSPEELELTCKREGEVPGTHNVRYTSSVDDIEIIHTAHNRKGFATGAVLAAEWLLSRKGIFTMKDLIHIS